MVHEHEQIRHINVESTLGMGTIFYFCLPLQLPPAGAVPVNLSNDTHTDSDGIHMDRLRDAHILVADDHPVNRLFASKILKKIGVRNITLVEDGKQAIEAVSNASYDVVLMDCQMPEMDGYAATQQIRQIEENSGKHTSIIAVTANAMVGDKEKCVQAGMDDYLSKPIKPEKLRQKLHKWLNKMDDENNTPTGSVTSQPATQTVSVSSPTIIESTGEAAPVDLKHLALFTDGDKEVDQVGVIAWCCMLVRQVEVDLEKLY